MQPPTLVGHAAGMHTAELARLLENLIRLGIVAEIDHGTPPRVRVKAGGLLTAWRP